MPGGRLTLVSPAGRVPFWVDTDKSSAQSKLCQTRRAQPHELVRDGPCVRVARGAASRDAPV
jgi:hypothetical protein